MINDPIGLAIEDYLKDNNLENIEVETTVTEDEKLPVSHFFRSYEDFPDQEKAALDLVKGKVLDVGAGAGCHALHLQNANYEITALDISKNACDVMLSKGVKDVVCEDIWNYKPVVKFDTLLFLMNGIGMVKDLEGLRLFLNHVKSYLKTGGQLLLDSADIIYMYEDEDGSVEIDLNAAYHGEIEYRLRYRDSDSGWFPWLYVGYEVLEDIAKECGYSSKLLFAGEDYQYSAALTLK